jgi:hypothetical protein
MKYHRVAQTMAAVITIMLCAPIYGQSNWDRSSIEKAWRERQEKAKSFSYRWTDEIFYPRGSISPGGFLGELLSPDKDSRVTMEFHFSSNDNRTRYGYCGLTWSHPMRRFIQVKYLSVQDGMTFKCLHDPHEGGTQYHDGSIATTDQRNDLRSCHTFAISSYHRGMNPLFRPIDLERARLGGGIVEIGSSRCVRLTEDNFAIFADVDKDFAPVRLIWTREGKITMQVDIKHSDDAVAGRRVTEWQVLSTLTGKLVSRQCRVEECIFNCPIPREQFDIVYPPGSRVTDRINNKQIVVGLPAALEISRSSLHRQSIGQVIRKHAISIVAFALAASCLLVLVRGWLRRSYRSPSKEV